ncbi:spidroin-2-like [Schistocerca serialis cubense]|uniref:spidroin-2-like n=1 Tax=Schistocerca serialis cubense TaxID=2023355 RepID=UPI00214F583A|nr:spidroin-2-like [Schistocerca serialis cubense]
MPVPCLNNTVAEARWSRRLSGRALPRPKPKAALWGLVGAVELEEARSPAAADVAAPVSASAAPTPGADSPSPAPEPEHLAPDASASATVPSSTSSCSASDEERGRSSDGGGGGGGGPVQTDPALCAASDDSPPAVAATLGLQGLLRVRALVAAAAIAASPDPPGAGAVTPESGGGSGPASSASASAAAAAAVAAAGCWGGEERARIAEYLQRADTAVIFPEPVAEPGAEPETAAARADAESATGEYPTLCLPVCASAFSTSRSVISSCGRLPGAAVEYTTTVRNKRLRFPD